VDLETTGWSPAHGDVAIEAAGITIRDGSVYEEWSSLMQTGRPVPAAASDVHGISEAMLAAAPPPRTVAALLRERCADHALVFHNASFDLAFLRPLFRDAGLPPLDNIVVDTLGLARGLFGSGQNTLGALRVALALPQEAEHRALGDARTTARILLALAPRWERERGTTSLQELAAVSQDVLRISPRRDSGFDSSEAGVAEPAASF
jgi:DNA polymerase-3 subunit epsilon